MAKEATIAGHSGRPRPQADGAGRRQVLEDVLRERRHAFEEPPAARTVVPDLIDAAQDREEEIVRLAVLDHGRDIQAQVEEALHCLAAGRYGLCADCGDPIQLARLRALPFALRCLPCQERLERRGVNSAAAMAGGPARRVVGPADRQRRHNGTRISAGRTAGDKNGKG